jgi:hypothetical protein
VTREWYHVQTSYHVLQALGLAASSPTEERCLVSVPTHPSQVKLIEHLAHLPGQPFTDVVVRPANRWGWRASLWQRRATATLNSRDLRRLLDTGGPSDVFTSNIQTIEGYTLAYHAKTAADPGKVALVEDGLGTYEKRPVLRASPREMSPRDVVRRMYLGPAGLHRLEEMPAQMIDELLVGYPDAIDQAAWGGIPVAGLPRPEDLRELLVALAERCLPDFGWERRAEFDVLLALPLSSLLPDPHDYAQRLATLLASLVRAGMRVGIKHHPRDDHPVVTDHAGATILPPGAPLELLLMVAGPNLRWLVTDRTTALVSAKRYRPDVDVVLLSGSIPEGTPRSEYDRVLSAAATRQVASFDELAALIAPG